MSPGAVGLKGRLLVATPPLTDPNFDRTVVLMLEHTHEGALGVVLNRPSEVRVREQLPAWAGTVGDPDRVFMGGPVQEDAVIALGLARADAMPAPGLEVFQPVWGTVGTVDLTARPDDVGVPLTGVRVFAGYAGWGAGQLEDELAEGAWIVVDALPDDVVTTRPEELWWEVLGRQGGELAWLALYPRDVDSN